MERGEVSLLDVAVPDREKGRVQLRVKAFVSRKEFNLGGESNELTKIVGYPPQVRYVPNEQV